MPKFQVKQINEISHKEEKMDKFAFKIEIEKPDITLEQQKKFVENFKKNMIEKFGKDLEEKLEVELVSNKEEKKDSNDT